MGDGVWLRMGGCAREGAPTPKRTRGSDESVMLRGRRRRRRSIRRGGGTNRPPRNDLPFTWYVVEVLRLGYSNGVGGQGNNSHKPEDVRSPWPREIRATLLSVNIRNKYGQAYGYELKQASLATACLANNALILFLLTS
jgi:hypothetical protein